MSKLKKPALYLASVLIPFTLYFAALMFLNAVPFGNNSIIISDANGQYLDLAAHWKTVLTGNSDFLYTFSKTLGGDGLNLAAYYLLSPINLIFLLSTTQTLPLFFTLVVILKASLCGLSFYHASSEFYGHKASGLLFSTAYAMMAYNVVYGWNIMWLDGVIILPLLVLGLFRLLEKKKPWLYVFSLAYSLAVNFYIGYMLCIASVIFCIAILALRAKGWKENWLLLFRFAASSVIGGFAAAIVWLPAFLSIAGERGQTNPFEFTLERSFGLLSFPAKLFCGAASPQDIMGGLPNIFCGTVILLLAALFFLNLKISLRKKITAGSVLLVLFLSFFFLMPNTIWHGFSPTNAFNYRYSFLFSFVLIILAQHQFKQKESVSSNMILLAAIVLLGGLLVSVLRKPHFLQTEGIAVTLIVLIVSASTLVAGKKTSKASAAVFIAVGILELLLNCCISWNAITNDTWTLKADTYADFIQNTGRAVDYVKETDDGFYRMEKNFHRSQNDAMLFSYHGLSHFSSTEPVFTKVFMRKMGLPTEYDFLAWYEEGSTAEVDSLLGVKYLLSKETLAGEKDYTLLGETNGINIYRNENALPIAMLCNEKITQVSLEETDLFVLHNKIWQGLTGNSGTILTPELFSVTTTNLTQTLTENGILYEKINPDAVAELHCTATVSKELPLYFFCSAPDYQNAEILINGINDGLYFHKDRWNMVNTGTHKFGESLTVSLRLTGDALSITEPFFYYEDAAVLSHMAAPLISGAPDLIHLSDSHLKGSFYAEEGQLLLFTIPRNSGWQLKIDSETISCITILDTFLAADVPAGNHEFELRYMPRGLIVGCGLTASALAAALLWELVCRKKQAK